MKKAIALITTLLVLGALAGPAQARRLQRPANDDISSAQAITALPFSQTVNLKGATLEVAESQPSCKSITRSVWFGFSVADEALVVAELSSVFGSAVAIYEQTEAGLMESACTVGNEDGGIEFKAVPDRVYLAQIGTTGKKDGLADFGLRLSEWVERTIWEYSFQRDAEEQHLNVLTVKGAPRKSDPRMYDLNITVAGRQSVGKGINTFGLVTEKIHAELARIPASSTHLRVKASGRYDSSQYTCAIDDQGGNCHAGAPFGDLNWLTGGEGSRAELVITLRAERNGEVLQERQIVIPYAGQFLGLLP